MLILCSNWGRPQRDGPALRASSIIQFINVLNATEPEVASDPEWISRLYDGKLPSTSVIKADLEYTSHTWRLNGFDAWEEVNGLHFFTAMVQLRAMKDGARLASAVGDFGAADWYYQQFDEIAAFLKRFWVAEKEHLISTLNTPRSGLNCDILLGAIHGAEEVYPPWSDEVLTSLERLVEEMKALYPLSRKHLPENADGKPHGVPIGRYVEDIYDGAGFAGGNPWFLCTASAAEVLYASVTHFREQGFVEVAPGNALFRSAPRALRSEYEKGGRIAADEPLFDETLDWMREYADSFLKVIRKHVDHEGRMSEQFDRHSGFMRGAEDLTWSYASFLAAVEAREKAYAA